MCIFEGELIYRHFLLVISRELQLIIPLYQFRLYITFLVFSYVFLTICNVNVSEKLNILPWFLSCDWSVVYPCPLTRSLCYSPWVHLVQSYLQRNA